VPFSFNPKAGNHSFFFDSQAVVEELGMCVFFFLGSFFPHSSCSLLLYLFCYMIRKAHVSGIGEQELHAEGFFFFGCLLEVVVLHHGDSLLCVLDILSSDVVAA
jgi:hypothetical protein